MSSIKLIGTFMGHSMKTMSKRLKTISYARKTSLRRLWSDVKVIYHFTLSKTKINNLKSRRRPETDITQCQWRDKLLTRVIKALLYNLFATAH